MINIASPIIGAEEKQAVMQVLDSGMIACGAVVSDFEKKFASYIGAEYGIATTSGTTALEVALRGLGIGQGDLVLTTAYSFIASTNSIVYTGARPVFVDIDPATFNMDMKKAEQNLKDNPGIKAMLVVHLFGQACDMDAVMDLAQRYNVKVIEDCAQAHGATWNGKKVGNIGHVSAFSFYPTKNMTTGEGGIVLTNDAKLADECRLLINHGMRIRYTHETVGYNYRMTNIAAAIGIEQLKRLDGFNAKRKEHAEYYNAHIVNALVTVPYVAENAQHVYHQYTIKVGQNKRQALIDLFEQNKIGYGIFYPTSIPEQPCYKEFGFNTVWPFVDEVKHEVLSLPVHPGLNIEQVAQVTRVINSL